MLCCLLCKVNVNGNVKSENIERKLILKAMMTMITFSLLTKNSPRSIQLGEVVNISYTADLKKKKKSCIKASLSLIIIKVHAGYREIFFVTSYSSMFTIFTSTKIPQICNTEVLKQTTPNVCCRQKYCKGIKVNPTAEFLFNKVLLY